MPVPRDCVSTPEKSWPVVSLGVAQPESRKIPSLPQFTACSIQSSSHAEVASLTLSTEPSGGESTPVGKTTKRSRWQAEQEDLEDFLEKRVADSTKEYHRLQEDLRDNRFVSDETARRRLKASWETVQRCQRLLDFERQKENSSITRIQHEVHREELQTCLEERLARFSLECRRLQDDLWLVASVELVAATKNAS